jgi:hypothetical protein
MNKLKLLCLVCLCHTASFALNSDTTKQQVVVAEQKTEIVSSVKDDQKNLGKRVFVSKKKTTWTKIKDLFM